MSYSLFRNDPYPSAFRKTTQYRLPRRRSIRDHLRNRNLHLLLNDSAEIPCTEFRAMGLVAQIRDNIVGNLEPQAVPALQ